MRRTMRWRLSSLFSPPCSFLASPLGLMLMMISKRMLKRYPKGQLRIHQHRNDTASLFWPARHHRPVCSSCRPFR